MADTCPQCGSTKVTQKIVHEMLEYGVAPVIEIPVDCPVEVCGDCGEEWVGNDGFAAREEAVADYRSR